MLFDIAYLGNSNSNSNIAQHVNEWGRPWTCILAEIWIAGHAVKIIMIKEQERVSNNRKG
jgi:hypothetical protein